MKKQFWHLNGILPFFLGLTLLFSQFSCRAKSSKEAGNAAASQGSQKILPATENTPIESREGEGETDIQNQTETPDSENGSPRKILPIPWSFSPAQYRGKNGQQFTFNCVPNGDLSSLYGTDIYTDDSSICTAAVHAGVISQASGVVTIEIRPGQDAYVGSTRNGIKSSDFTTKWSGSFVFVAGGGGS